MSTSKLPTRGEVYLGDGTFVSIYRDAANFRVYDDDSFTVSLDIKVLKIFLRALYEMQEKAEEDLND